MLKVNPKYKHIFFDLDHTLWDFNANAKVAMKLCLEETGLIAQLPDFDIFFAYYEQVNDRLWDEYRKELTSKQELSEKRFTEPLAHFGIKEIDWELLNETYLRHMANQTLLMPGARSLLEKLSKKGYEMHIITNGFIEVQQLKLKNSQIAHFFSSVTMSEMVGVSKPKPAIFEYALKRNNAKKSESIMIGDDWQNDVLGAFHFGMDAIYYNPQLEKLDIACEIKAHDSYVELLMNQSKSNHLYQLDKLINIYSILD